MQTDAIIEAKEATIQQQKAAMEIAGVTLLPLKKQGLILSKQLIEFANAWPTNANPNELYMEFERRFDYRIKKLHEDFDVHGQRSQKLDNLTQYGPMLPQSFPLDFVLMLSTGIQN